MGLICLSQSHCLPCRLTGIFPKSRQATAKDSQLSLSQCSQAIPSYFLLTYIQICGSSDISPISSCQNPHLLFIYFPQTFSSMPFYNADLIYITFHTVFNSCISLFCKYLLPRKKFLYCKTRKAALLASNKSWCNQHLFVR